MSLLWVSAVAYIGDQESDWLAENKPAVVEVQRTDEDEVRVGALLIRDWEESKPDDVTLYLSVAEASRLAHLLGIAVLANEAAAHEAASL